MTENSPNWGKDTFLQVQETEKTPNRRNSKKSMLKYIMSNVKTKHKQKKILKAVKEK